MTVTYSNDVARTTSILLVICLLVFLCLPDVAQSQQAGNKPTDFAGWTERLIADPLDAHAYAARAELACDNLGDHAQIVAGWDRMMAALLGFDCGLRLPGFGEVSDANSEASQVWNRALAAWKAGDDAAARKLVVNGCKDYATDHRFLAAGANFSREPYQTRLEWITRAIEQAGTSIAVPGVEGADGQLLIEPIPLRWSYHLIRARLHYHEALAVAHMNGQHSENTCQILKRAKDDLLECWLIACVHLNYAEGVLVDECLGEVLAEHWGAMLDGDRQAFTQSLTRVHQYLLHVERGEFRDALAFTNSWKAGEVDVYRPHVGVNQHLSNPDYWRKTGKFFSLPAEPTSDPGLAIQLLGLGLEPVVKRAWAEQLAWQSLEAQLADKLDETSKLSQQALELDPECAIAWYATAGLSIERQDHSAAIPDLRRAMEYDPKMEPYVIPQLLICFVKTGDWEQLDSMATRAMEVIPDADHAEIHFLRSVARIKLGQVADGIADLRDVLTVAPDHVGAIRNLAWLLATCAETSLRNADEAAHLLERGRSLGVNEVTLLVIEAAIVAQRGEFDRAKTLLDQAIQIGGQRNWDICTCAACDEMLDPPTLLRLQAAIEARQPFAGATSLSPAGIE